MKWLLLFGLILCVIGDLTFLDGQYTHEVTSGLTRFGDWLRTAGNLWGA